MAKETIKCKCGYDTGLQNPILMYMPDGLRCPQCGEWIIYPNYIDVSKTDVNPEAWKTDNNNAV